MNCINKWKNKLMFWTSGQDGGIGKYTLPPHTNKRTTTNLKTKTNQNYQKTKLYGSPTTKEIKKKHSSRLAGGAEMGSQGGEQGGSWRTGQGGRCWRGWPHICNRIGQEEQLVRETDYTTQG